MGASLTANQNENTSVGLNLAWDPSDKLSLEFDFHDSSAESTPNSPYGSNNVIGTASLAILNQGINFENYIPVMSLLPTRVVLVNLMYLTRHCASSPVMRSAMHCSNDATQMQLTVHTKPIYRFH